MKQLYTPEKEFKDIDDSLKKEERRALWLALAALILLLAVVLVIANEKISPNQLKKESPKRTLQASLHAY